MNCNISVIIIFLLLIIIIGMILVSQKNSEKSVKEKKGSDVVSDVISNVEGFNMLTDVEMINSNNDTINNLLSILQKYKPNIQLTGSANIQNDMSKTFKDGVNIVDQSLNSLYESNNKAIEMKMKNIQKKVADIKRTTDKLKKEFITTKKYQRIKSLNNGLEMDLINTPNTRFQDDLSGSNIAAYMVSVNNGCLSVGATDYDVYQCDDTNIKQYFKMEHILNETAYQNAIDSALPFDNIDKSKINYPFVMMKSINNENCLTNTHGNLTVQPCYSYVAQRWMAL